MSYANGTTHYNLPQTVGTDKRDWADTNQAFADVDAALYTASETASSAASSITALAATVAQLHDAQITFQSDLDDVELTVSQHSTSIGNLNDKIGDVEDDCLDMICAVDQGTAQVASVAVSEGDYFRYNNVLYMATANIAIGDTIVPNTNCTATNVATELENIESAIEDKQVNLGAQVELTDSTAYTTTSDGYLSCVVPAAAGAGSSLARITSPNGATTFIISADYSAGHNIFNGIYVPKGLTITPSISEGCTMVFVPFTR